MRIPIRSAALALAALLTTGVGARADVPHTLGYQGRLLKADGTAATGVLPITYAVFDAEEGGNKLWNETQSTALTEGYYAAFLGSVTAFPDELFDGAERYLQVTVDGEDLLPRQRIASVAFTLRAHTAQNVKGGTVDATRLSVNGQTVIDEQGRLTGSALYTAGSGLRFDAATNTLSLADGCALNEVLRWDGSAWACAAAAHPLTAGSGLVLEGNNISLPGSCSANQVLKFDGARWGCGVDTDSTITVGSGLEMNGSTLRLATTCTAGQMLKFDGTAWACAADTDTDTTYTAGNGLVLDGTSFGLPTSCAEGEMLKWNGTAWACAADVDTDTNTTYTANNGVELSGTTFGLLSSCADGELLKWTGTTWACAADVDTNTTYTAGSGLELNGTTFRLPTSCADGEMLKWDGTEWACAADVDTNTTYTASNGIVLNGTTFGLPTTCAEGEMLKWNGSTWACAADVDTDTNTTYTAGSGLELNGTQFRLPTSCASGELLKWNGSAWSCAADLDIDTNTTYTAGSGLELNGSTFRLTTTCSAGEMLKWNGSAWACAADVDTDTTYAANHGVVLDNGIFGLRTDCAPGEVLAFDGSGWSCTPVTEYAAGSGLELSGSTFRLPTSCATGEMLKWNGSAWACAADVDTDTNTTYSAGSGLELNGSQFRLAAFPSPGTAGTAPSWNTGTAPPTLQLPLASAANVTAGLLSNADYQRFGAKQDALTFSAPLDLSGTTVSLAQASSVANGFLSSSDWSVFSQKFGPSTALGAGRLWVGSSSNTPAAVALGGDATLAADGTLTLAASGVTAGSYAKVTVDAKGRVTGGSVLSASDIPSLDASKIASGVLAVANGGTGVSSASQGTVFAGPTSGSGAPGFRTLALSDLPANVATQWSNGIGSINYAGGSVGIGVPSPAAALDVNGAIKAATVANNSTTIDFAGGNLQSTSVSCGAMTLNNMKNGATYSLAVQGTTGGTCAFTANSGNGTGALTVRTGPISLVQTAGKHAVFSFMVIGGVVYLASIDGY